ncbi:MAG: hypothetical protein VX690_08795 [Pseudomonadota bacterium]|jgi:hypothetical protein|nr:hypothetical protein [Pseudomonadota bacterium]
MRKLPNFLTTGFAVVVGCMFTFSSPLLAQGMGPNLENMFLNEDTDDFDPGVPVGMQFPMIRARYEGEEITSIDGFHGDKGLIFFAVRSADW